MCRLTSKYEWKPMRIVLTEYNLYLSRPEEEVLRDMVPLDEMTKIRKVLHSDGAPTIPQNSESSINRSASITPVSARHYRGVSFHALFEARQGDDLHVFQIQTVDGGYNSGRTIHLRTTSDAACEEWVALLRTAAARAARRGSPGLCAGLQRRVRALHNHSAFQAAVAALIFACFLANVVQMELLSTAAPPPGSPFAYLEAIFCAAFAAELLVNLAANFLLPFARDPWNWLDVTVVAISLAALARDDVPGVNALRLVRTLRSIYIYIIYNVIYIMSKPTPSGDDEQGGDAEGGVGEGEHLLPPIYLILSQSIPYPSIQFHPSIHPSIQSIHPSTHPSITRIADPIRR